MTGRTHDAIALTCIIYIAAVTSPAPISLATVLVAIGANLTGGIAPDIDQPTAHLWQSFPEGSIIGRIISPLLGGHRLISHSFIGIILFGIGLNILLTWAKTFLLVNMQIVWWSFMIGYISHLVADTFTHEGVPWLFPISIRFGLPPIKSLRIKTGGLIEKLIIFPGFVCLQVYLIYTHYGKFLDYIHKYIKY